VVDEVTLEAARRGEPRALRSVFDTHVEAVMRLCLVSTGVDRDGAKDLAQEVFVRAFRSLDTLSDPGRMRSWLFAIARNVCRDRAARERRYREILDSLAIEQQLDLDRDDPLEREARISAVARVIGQVMDPKLKEIVKLKYGEPEHTTREIAERLGIPHGTVTVKLMRFRAAAKRDLVRALLDTEVEA
jgi:RNA polymerase sigma-70 factor (ECF subfamily)